MERILGRGVGRPTGLGGVFKGDGSGGGAGGHPIWVGYMGYDPLHRQGPG